MKKVLLVNPPIYDFAAYDFWLKPYGLLTVGGYLQNSCDIELFDYMDREVGSSDVDEFGRGRFSQQIIEKPQIYKDIPRYYRRFGKPREDFRIFLRNCEQVDYVLIQTVMTYWYPGYKEVIEDVRELLPGARIVLGGVYAMICNEHAEGLGADFVLKGTCLEKLWSYMHVEPDLTSLPFWQGYLQPGNGVMKITDGCPFSCSYCSVPNVYGGFKVRNMQRAFDEFDYLAELGVENIAFYDDSLLFKFDEVLKPFLDYVVKHPANINLHTPNALNARFINEQVAERMVRAGFKTFYIGYESGSPLWQDMTGGKVYQSEFEKAVEILIKAGANPKNITAYIILGHPKGDLQQVEDSMQKVHDLGIRIQLADFSPIPGTEDGQLCSKWVDMDEPLCHNKSAFPCWVYGFEEINRFKNICREMNRNI